jgi:hypothetical protein
MVIVALKKASHQSSISRFSPDFKAPSSLLWVGTAQMSSASLKKMHLATFFPKKSYFFFE